MHERDGIDKIKYEAKKIWKLINVEKINYKGENKKFKNLDYNSSFNGY